MKPDVRAGRYPAHAQRRASIRVTRRYLASPEHVFHAWLDPKVARSWLFATATRPMARAEIDPRVAGTFRFVEQRDGEIVEHRGEYVDMVPHRRLAFTLATPDQPHVLTRVRVEITRLGQGCEVTLTHDDVPSGNAIRTRARWTGILYGLGMTLASQTRGMTAAPA